MGDLISELVHYYSDVDGCKRLRFSFINLGQVDRVGGKPLLCRLELPHAVLAIFALALGSPECASG